MSRFKRQAKLVEKVVAAFVEAKVAVRDYQVIYSDGEINMGSMYFKADGYSEQDVRMFTGRVAEVAASGGTILGSWHNRMLDCLERFLMSQGVIEEVSSRLISTAVENKRNAVLVAAYRNGWDGEPEFVKVMDAKTVEELEVLSRKVSQDRVSAQLSRL
jgi:hypothetical protein